MKVLDGMEIHGWFKKFPYRSSEHIQCDEKGPYFSGSEASCIDLEYPKLERLPSFTRLLSTIGYEDWDFQGALLWFTEWGVWNLADEGIGYRLVEAMHAAAGQPRSFEVSPGHRFRADELNEATAMLLLPIAFGWDAVYVPSWSYGLDQFFLHVSHDSYVTIVTRTKEFYEKAFGILEKVDLNPKRACERQIQRFCRAPEL